MAIDVASVRQRAAAAASGFSRGQLITMGAVGLAVVVGLFAFSRMAGSADMAPLYSELEPTDASALTQRLDEEGVPYELADGGRTILVPQDRVYETRVAVSDVALPSNSETGYGILDSQGLMTSEFSQRVGFQRAMEGELNKTIEAIDGVESATVHLAIPRESSFALDDEEPSASVMVTTRPGSELQAGQVQAIVNVVASSIQGMSPEAVTVADDQGRVLAAPGEGGVDGAAGDFHQQQRESYESSVAAAIEQMLVRVVGPGKAAVNVSAELDFDQRTTDRESWSQPEGTAADGQVPLNESTRTETYTGETPVVAGILGPEGDPNAGGAGTDYTLEETERSFAVDRVVESTQAAPGTVERLSVAVLVDEETTDVGQVAEIEQLVTASAGLLADRGDRVEVTRMPFDTSAEEAREAEEEAAAEAEAQAASARLVRTLALGGAILALLVVATLAFRRARRRSSAVDIAELEAALTAQLPAGRPVADARTAGAAEVELAPLDAELLQPSAEELELRQREAVVAELIDNQPDEVAALLRGWLGDRRAVHR